MEPLLWMFLPVFVAAGAALLSFYIMQAKMDVALAKERESLAEARAIISAQAQTMEEKVKATEQQAARKAMDELLSEFRTEERHYVRESKTGLRTKKSMVLQERLFFRNIPLSNWVEHEMVVEEGGDAQQLAQSCSIFSTKSLGMGAVGSTSRDLTRVLAR